MAENYLNNYSDDAKIKEYIQYQLAPKVFHDIPLNVLNTGHFSLINEYMSQAMEDMAYTASFYLNENFITKAVLSDSIYSEAAIFDIGYSFAIPSSCNFLLELKISDLLNSATPNQYDSSIMEFILDKDTKFNLSNGSVYSLDYDILIQYQKKQNSNEAVSWNIQYTNTDVSNSISKNDKNIYILYRVTDVWLCLFVQASEYTRQTHIVTNNMTNGLPNPDKVIRCTDHICGFDVKYVSGTRSEYIARDHILPIHSDVRDNEPYIHYIMDDPQTIRFMFQLNGSRYFVPEMNSSYEITIYTCHGDSANFTAFKNDEQPNVLTNSNVYPNNANITKCAYVISGSMGGTNIGTVETVRRETTEAYNTANVISSDHDIDEWFKTFNFKNVLYPFFFKRRDDPWGRIWSGFLALKDSNNNVYRTNTLHCKIPYDILYNNNDNSKTANEVIIPPGWIWVYGNENRFTVVPYVDSDTSLVVETAKTLSQIEDKFVFANPFGIRIQKDPFAIGYFNPWINEYMTCSRVNTLSHQLINDNDIDPSKTLHATPILSNIVRTYTDDYYRFTTYVLPNYASWDTDETSEKLVKYLKMNAVAPIISDSAWLYFVMPMDLMATNIPMLRKTADTGALPFNPTSTYLCTSVRTPITEMDGDMYILGNVWIEESGKETDTPIMITGSDIELMGTKEVWVDNPAVIPVYTSGSADIDLVNVDTTAPDCPYITFSKNAERSYYELRVRDDLGDATPLKSLEITLASHVSESMFSEDDLYMLGQPEQNVYFKLTDENNVTTTYCIVNAAAVYTPYEPDPESLETNTFIFNLANVGSSGIILYAEQKSTSSDSVSYYKLPFSSVAENKALFYIKNKTLPLELNNMRVVLQGLLDNSVSGYIEMQPVNVENDGSIRYEAIMQPLNELVDADNCVKIASTDVGGGNWIPSTPGQNVLLDATDTELKISVFIKSTDSTYQNGDNPGISSLATGFRLVDAYTVDDLSLVQELKDMRSVVNFEQANEATAEQTVLYEDMLELAEYNPNNSTTVFTVERYAYNSMMNITPRPGDPAYTFDQIKTIATNLKNKLNTYFATYRSIVVPIIPDNLNNVIEISLNSIIDSQSTDGSSLDWETIWSYLNNYVSYVNEAFEPININGGVEIQLVPMVKHTLMNDKEEFPTFVEAFTQVHKAIEPVIFDRLEGNNYLDCKLIATYGLPHSYSSDIDYKLENVFWPDLDLQIEFDIKLYNQNMATNTINELKTLIKDYFSRLTKLHTANDILSTNNNVYISHVIQQMESHPNVEYMKFKGWYTNEKYVTPSNYMDANTQAIVQKWRKLEDFPKKELERFVPEMFVLDDDNIIINIL